MGAAAAAVDALAVDAAAGGNGGADAADAVEGADDAPTAVIPVLGGATAAEPLRCISTFSPDSATPTAGYSPRPRVAACRATTVPLLWCSRA